MHQRWIHLHRAALPVFQSKLTKSPRHRLWPQSTHSVFSIPHSQLAHGERSHRGASAPRPSHGGWPCSKESVEAPTFFAVISDTIRSGVRGSLALHPQPQDACCTLLLPARTNTTTHFSRGSRGRPRRRSNQVESCWSQRAELPRGRGNPCRALRPCPTLGFTAAPVLQSHRRRS